MDIFDLVATLSLDSTPYEQGLQGAEQNASSAGSAILSGMGKVGAGIGAVAGVAVAGVTAVSGALVNGVTDLAEYGDSIDKNSQKMGISAVAYQEWQAVMEHSGTSMESLKSSMKTMANAVENGNEAFERLGITEEQIASLSQEDLFAEVITGLQNMEASTERTYLAGQLLGRGATELGALLNTSAEETQAMKDRVHELGGVLSDEAVKASASFQDQLQDMQTATEGLKRNLLSDFLPSITQVMGGLTDIFAGDYDKGAEGIASGIDNVVSQITNKLPEFMEVGTKIVLSIADSIVENLPKILVVGMDVVTELITGITDMLPKLIDIASELVVTLFDKLSETLPELIPKVTEAVIVLIEKLLDNLPAILESLLNFITIVTESLLEDGLPIIIKALPDIIMGIVNFILTAIPDIINAVITIVQAIAENLPLIIQQIVDILPSLIDSIISALMENLPVIIDAGIRLFLALIEAMPQIIMAIVGSIPQIIEAIIKALVKAFPQIMETGKQILGQLLEGLTNIGSSIANSVKKIWDNLKENFKKLINNAKTWGTDLLTNFIDGIKSKISAVTDAVKGVADKVKDFLGFSEPKLGPLSNFHTFAPDMMELFAKGIEDNEKLISDQIADSFDFGNEITSVTKPDENATMGTGTNMNRVIELLTIIANKEPVEISENGDNIFDLVVRKSREYYKANNKNALAY